MKLEIERDLELISLIGMTRANNNFHHTNEANKYD